MIVIADTSPISYLILIDEIEILPRLYKKVLIPRGVSSELKASNAPSKVRLWFEHQPQWLETRDLTDEVEERLSKLLDKGESEAIQLARDLTADLILIDELQGRKIAAEYGLRVIGLIGVLAEASKRGLIDIDAVILQLEETNFFISEDLIDFLRNTKN